jgi:hypothetical protein
MDLYLKKGRNKKMKFKIELEIDPERVEEMFDEREIKFSKRKMTELKKILQENMADWIAELEERFEEIVDTSIEENFEQ